VAAPVELDAPRASPLRTVLAHVTDVSPARGSTGLHQVLKCGRCLPGRLSGGRWPPNELLACSFLRRSGTKCSTMGSLQMLAQAACERNDVQAVERSSRKRPAASRPRGCGSGATTRSRPARCVSAPAPLPCCSTRSTLACGATCRDLSRKMVPPSRHELPHLLAHRAREAPLLVAEQLGLISSSGIAAQLPG